MSKLSAMHICQEALEILRAPTFPKLTTKFRPAFLDFGEQFKDKQYYSAIAISPKQLELPLAIFSENYIRPAIYQLFGSVSLHSLSDEMLYLPRGVYGAANERYKGVAMRVVIDWIPVGPEYPGWTKRESKFYRVTFDDFISTGVGLALRFDVHLK